MSNCMEDLGIARFRQDKTHQITTFNLADKSKTVTVARGQRVTLADITCHGVITSLWMTFPGWFWQHWDPGDPVSQTILKTLILRIYWDGCTRPAVEAPVGDFFGNGLCEASNFASQYFGMSSGGFFSKFPMPFRKGFRVELENLDEFIDADVYANILYQQTEISESEMGWFHAQFRTGRHEGPEPIEILKANGRGHYIGCVLSAQGLEQNYLSFLEAPEFIWIDDDWQTPSITGTGMEDYFLGGWYFREGPFAGPMHGVPSKDSFNSSIAMYRVHDRDAINFKKSIKFQFVNPWAPQRLKPYAYSSVAFSYLDRPDGGGQELPAPKDLLCWYRIKNTDHASIP